MSAYIPDLTPTELARIEMALEFEALSDTALDLAIRAAVIQHGGTLVPPKDEWGPLECELSLLGLSATGDTPAVAARGWTKHCLRSCGAMSDGEAA